MSETGTQSLTDDIPASGVFDPPAELADDANVTAETYQRAADDRLGFWADAAQRLDWTSPWDEVLDWTNPPFAKWFTGGELNVAVNCVDRHVADGRGDVVAYHWVGEPGDTRDITYAQLKDEVCKAANALVSLGVQAGDRVAIYLPMIPEAVISMLACARIGAVHMVVFGGFSPDALASRVEDAGAKVVITADGGYRRGAPSPLKPAVDEALGKVSGVDHVVVVKRTEADVEWTEGRDQWWHDLVDGQSTEHEAQAFDAEHPLYIMYTSGTTAKPKGILHTSGGYLTQVSWTHWATFDLKRDTDVYWCAADVAWVTGHSYIVYGPLSNGATSVMYEGTPETPHRGRWWEIVQQYRVSILYAAPTVVRTFMKWGAQELEPFDTSSLRVLGSVGEPINPEAWLWYRKNVGGGTATVVDTWWQTETGAHMIAPMPGVTATKPGSAQRAIPGISAAVVDEEGKPIEPGATGYLVLTEPWPAMLRTIWGSDERYVETYWSRYGNRGLLRRRRGQARRGRRHLAARPGGRRDERVRAPHLHHRGGVGAGQPPDRRRGRRRGGDRPHHRPGHRRLRHPARGRPGLRRGPGEAAAPARAQGDRPDRLPAPDHGRGGAAQDPLGQDHAPPAAGRGREPGARRCLDADRLLGHGHDQREDAGLRGGLSGSVRGEESSPRTLHPGDHGARPGRA